MTRHSVNPVTIPVAGAPGIGTAGPPGAPEIGAPPGAPQYAYLAPPASVTEELNAAYTLQNMHHAGKSSAPETRNELADADFLTCGSCQKEFLLANIVDFMRHKKLDCRDAYNGPGPTADLYQRLMCQITNCHERFATAWALLQHVQNSHALNIFLNSYSSTLNSVNSDTSSTAVTSSNSAAASLQNTTSLTTLNSTMSSSASFLAASSYTQGVESVQVQSQPQSQPQSQSQSQSQPQSLSQPQSQSQPQPQPQQNSATTSSTLDMTTLLSLGDTFQDLQMREERQSVETQTEKNENEEECEEPCEDFCSPEVCEMRKCCDTQNCCITIMPGTHERPKKCCSSVVPKKRKQHMEQHIHSGPASRTRRRKSGETRPPTSTPDRIFIDFGTPMDSSTNAQQTPNFDQNFAADPNDSGFIQVEGTNMYVRNADNTMTFSVDQPSQQNYDVTNDVTLQEPFQSLFMDELSLDLPESQPKEEKKKRYPTSKPFKCDHCGMAFNQRIHLKKHLSKHTGIKPFKCGQCNYSTVERSHLKVHIRIHTGEKPFKCGFCEYATAQNSTLKIHLKRHHSGMTLSCTVCGEKFEQPKLLNQHQQAHEGHSLDT